jgi:phosphatidylethanolamine-binding protein (PEBP) family uncharacterized protein
MTKTLLALAITLGLVGGTSAQTSNPPKMGVDLIFDPKHKCQGISPEIRLSNVPAGVASYEVKLTDLDVPTFHHWSQTLPAEGPVIHEGAGSGYFGPCPPSGTHRYEITVVARDGQSRAVASGEKIVVTGK